MRSYWSSGGIEETPFFRKVMSRDRWLQILSCIRLYDPVAKLVTREDNPKSGNYDPLFKIRGFLDLLYAGFLKHWVPGRHLAIDEMVSRM